MGKIKIEIKRKIKKINRKEKLNKLREIQENRRTYDFKLDQELLE